MNHANRSIVYASAVFTIVTVVSATRTLAADSAYAFVNNVVAVEAESLPYNSVWTRRTDKTGFTGSAWLQYTGPERHGNESSGQHDDPTGIYQGTEADWLKVPVYVTQAGLYYVQIHAFHTMYCCNFVNGDATVWTHAKDYPLPVRMSHGETAGGANTFSFLGYGPLIYYSEDDAVMGPVSFTIQTVPQMVTFYVSGRDRNLGVDRIHIYRRTGPDSQKRGCYPVNADNKNAPLSAKIAVPTTAIEQQAFPAAAIAPAPRRGLSVQLPGKSSIASTSKATYDLRGVQRSPTSTSSLRPGCYVSR